jgi:hypothetical protein
MRLLLTVALTLSMLTFGSVATATDLDVGCEAELALPSQGGGLDLNCFQFGGTSESFSGSDRGRGNTYTVSANQTLTNFSMELGFTGNVDLYFYVLESATLDGTYTVLSETIVPTVGTGQAFYDSGTIDVSLSTGMYYGIGVAWQSASVTYYRDVATLPRPWALGTVEDAMQISASPPYGSMTYNHFPGAEYSMVLCFNGGTPVQSSTWGNVKALYQ